MFFRSDDGNSPEKLLTDHYNPNPLQKIGLMSLCATPSSSWCSKYFSNQQDWGCFVSVFTLTGVLNWSWNSRSVYLDQPGLHLFVPADISELKGDKISSPLLKTAAKINFQLKMELGNSVLVIRQFCEKEKWKRRLQTL